MLNKQLNVGDHIVNSKGELFLIERVNKTTYSIVPNTSKGYARTIPFNGKEKDWSSTVIEYFPCDDAVEQIIANLRKENDRLEKELQEQESEIKKAQAFKENLEWLSYSSLSELEKRVDRLDEKFDEDEE